MPRATDIMPITAFTRNYTKVVARLKKSGRPHVLTIDGKPALIVQDAAAFDAEADAAFVAAEITKSLADPRPSISLDDLKAKVERASRAGWKKPTRRSKAA